LHGPILYQVGHVTLCFGERNKLHGIPSDG
jgi:hypothetical protein